jgi:YVTN family beta-propeller protein
VLRGGPSIPIPVLWPIASGPFVNFESYPVKGLALSGDGTLLFAVNTPNNSLSIIETLGRTDALPKIVNEIPVGLDPVSVAVQPDSGDRFVWVANFVSDDVSVIDMQTEQVVAVIDVGNEPAQILFSDDGAFAYVVLQGNVKNTSTTDVLPYLVTIDTATRLVVHELRLVMNATRTAIYDAATDRIVVAAMHSGNNKGLAGVPVRATFTNDPNDNGVLLYSLQLVGDFSVTAAAFAASSLAPWPDPSAEPSAPFVPRIVPDAGVAGNEWQRIIDLLTLPDGSIDPAVSAQFASEFGITNPDDVLEEIVHDVKDTLDHDLAMIDVSTPATPALVQYVSDVGTTLMGIAKHPAQDSLFVANTEALTETRLVTGLVAHSVDHRITIVSNLAPPTVNPTDLHAGVTNFNLAVPDGAPDSLALPMDVVFNGDGSRAYVAAFGPGRVGVLDGTTAQVLARIDVGPGPRSLAIDDARSRLYVLNRNNMSISTLDVANPQPFTLQTLYLFNPEPAVIKNGRTFANDTRHSPNNATSCATCHINMHHDNMSWDLGEPAGGLQPVPSNVTDPNGNPLSNHPMKGPMFTLSLRGLKDHDAYHWRGDKPELVDFNGTFELLFGGSPLPQPEMQALSDYIDTITVAPNPHYTRTNQLESATALDGAVHFVNRCNGCHALSQDGTLRNANGEDDAGGVFTNIFAQIQEITQLRQIEKKFNDDVFTGFGLVHDGRETREPNDPTQPLDPDINHPLQTFLKTFFPGFDLAARNAIIEFMTAYPTNTLPVVGWQVRMTNPSDAFSVTDINTMIALSRSTPSQNDVVAHGAFGGAETGFVLRASDPNQTPEFMSDTFELFTLTDLLNSLQAGDALVFMAVPPGSGQRIGVDTDLDCELNGLDPFPTGTPDLNGDHLVNITDLGILLAHFGQSDTPREEGDITGDGNVNISDLGVLLAKFGQSMCSAPPE